MEFKEPDSANGSNRVDKSSDITFVLLKNKTETPITLEVYIDDTIDNLKNKLSRVLNKDVKQYYLFHKKQKFINPYDIYKKLSLNNTKPIDKQIFISFCMNHNIEPIEKEEYDIDDFLKLNLTEVEVNEPIGVENKSFIVNPFDNIFNYYDNAQSVSSLLIMDYNIKKIYVCLAEDVYPYFESTGLEIEHTANIYFPYLFSEQKFKLDGSSFVDKYSKYDKMIGIQHKLFNKEMATKHMGLTSMNLVIYTKQSFIFPSEIFFRLLQTTKDIPLIKLNPGKKQENIYRIFSPKISENGNKVPLLKKKRITKIINSCKKENTLYYVVDQVYKEKIIQIIVEINKSGHIYVTVDELELFDFNQIESVIKQSVEIIISKLFEYFDPSHQIFNKFESLLDDSVEIIDFKYKFIFKRQTKFDIGKYIKCFSSIFNFVEDSDKIRLRYKRVSNFNELESMDAFLVDLINQQQTRDFIINALSRDYNITMEEATQKFDGVLAMYRANEEMNRSTNRIFRIKNNPGFPIEIFKKERTIDVEISNINNVQYVYFLSIFINNLILLAQHVIKDDSITQYCDIKEVKIIDIEYEREIDAPIEFTNNTLDFRIKPGENIGEESEEDLFKRLQELEERDNIDEEFKDITEFPVTDVGVVSPTLVSPNSANQKSATPNSVRPNSATPNLTPEEVVPSESDSIVDGVENNKSNVQSNEESDAESDITTPDSVDEESDAESDITTPDSVDEEQSDIEELEPVVQNDMNLQSVSNSVDTPESVSGSKSSKRSNNSLFLGGAYAINNEKVNLFFYDEHTKKEFVKLFKRDIDWKAAEIKHYFRCMVNSYCTLVEKENTKCRGAMTSLSEPEIDKIKMEGFERKQLVIYDKEGNKYKGYVFIHPEQRFVLPPIEYIREVYLALKTTWKEIDGDKKLYVYDEHYELKGFFDGTDYLDKEDARIADSGHSNPFLKRLQEKEPTLFLKEDDAQYSQYSRLCAWSQRRHPVVLTKEEKDEIDREAPGTYDTAVEYGTDPSNKFYYICPKYWNLKTNKPMLEKDVDPSKVMDIDKKASKLSKGKSMKDKYIFQFSTVKEGHYPLPGFLDSKKHPKGHFIPCCFKMKKNPGKVEEYKELIGKMNKPRLIDEIKKEKIKKGKTPFTADELNGMSENSLKNILIENKMFPDFLLKRRDDAEKLMAQERVEEKIGIDKYVQNGLKFPLDKQRIGFLTLTLEKFFHVSSNDYYSNIKKREFKINQDLLFRYGIEQNKNTSFLSAIGSILINQGILKGNPVDSLIEYIRKVVTLENIQEFHNGKLTSIFSEGEILDDTQRLEKGYSKFIEYIRDKNKYVDYRYLWDIVCGILFKKRINMIILYEPMDDTTNNLSIICPTTYHSRFKFDLTNPSIILYKKGDFFEPLFYANKKVSKKLTMIDPNEYKFLFNLKDSFIAKTLKFINKHLSECKEINVNKKYNFKQNKSLEEIQTVLPEGYTIKSQVISFDYTIIGAIININTTDFFIPCRPGNIIPEIEIIRIDDVEWHSYDETIEYLSELYKQSEKQIYCRPLIRVLEDTMIVGVLTMTNQFIQLNEPEQDEYEEKDRYGLDKIEEHNYINDDYNILHNPVSNYKDKLIHKLKLEKKFYNAYFNILKIEINKFENIVIRQRIEEILKASILYAAKIEQIKDLLAPLIEEKIKFIVYSDSVLSEMEDINLCKTDIEQSYCTPDGSLLIPTLNLYTKQKNNELYLIKFIDGILRNHTIKISVFEHSHSTIYFTDKYNLTEDELLLLESLLLPYLERLGKTVYSNEKVTYLSFEDLQPEEILKLADIAEVEYQSPELKLDQAKLKVKSDLGEDEDDDNDDENTESESYEDDKDSDSDDKNSELDKDDTDSDSDEEDEEEPSLEDNKDNAKQLQVDDSFDSVSHSNIPNNINNDSNVKNENQDHENDEKPHKPDKEEDDLEDKEEDDLEDKEDDQDDDNNEKNQQNLPVRNKDIHSRIPSDENNEDDNEDENEEDELPSRIISNEKREKNFGKSKIVIKPQNSSSEEEFDLSFEPRKSKKNAESKSESKSESSSESRSESISRDIERPRSKIVFKRKPVDSGSSNSEPLPLSTFKSKHMLKCIDRGIDIADYPTDKWKKLLPTKTKRFRIKLSDDFSCNYLLLIYLLKDFDKKYSNYKITDVKQMLIQCYKMDRYKESILKKWANENKKEFVKLIKKRKATIESVILSPNYFITTIDIVLIMHFYKIPIVLLYQQKGKSTTLSMNNEKDYYYFIKVKTKKQFFLHYIDTKLLKTFRFHDISDAMSREIDPIRISEYFENDRF